MIRVYGVELLRLRFRRKGIKMKKSLLILALGVVGASANATTFTFSAFQVQIPDSAATMTNFNVAGLDGAIVDVNLRMTNVVHTWTNDMGSVLSNNTGSNVLLFDGPGDGDTSGSSWNWLFDDSAASPLPDGNPLISGAFKPGQDEWGDLFANTTPNTSTMNGLNAGSNGIWVLHMEDFVNGDFGSIERVDLVITTAVPEPATMTALTLGAVAFIRRRRK